jgi:hypothetical protein
MCCGLDRGRPDESVYVLLTIVAANIRPDLIHLSRVSKPQRSLTPLLKRLLTIPSKPPVLPLSDADAQECEALLRRAIEMVRGPTQPAARKRLPASKPPCLVRIHYDPDEAVHIAINTKSGLSMLRHRDITRLRAMCDRLGWQVMAYT